MATAVAYRSVLASAWLFSALSGLSEVQATFREVYNGVVPKGFELPYLVFVRHPGSLLAVPMGRRPVAETIQYDVVGWCAGRSTDPILDAMEAVDARLAMVQRESFALGATSCQITSRSVGTLPPEYPPNPGEPVAARLGKQYAVFVG